jgi:HK97 family phage major capsid protein
MTRLAELRQKLQVATDRYVALADKDTLNDNERRDHDSAQADVISIKDAIRRHQDAQQALIASGGAQPTGDGLNRAGGGPLYRVPANPESDPYVNEAAAIGSGCRTRKGLGVGAMMRLMALAEKSRSDPIALATQIYGESHPVSVAVGYSQRAMLASVGASGGFAVPPDYAAEIIELLIAATVVRGSGPRVIPMPRGNMIIPGLALSATAGYGPEGGATTASQPTLRDIEASFKKLTALVPVSNSLMRYAEPAADAMVRDNLVDAIGITEDTAFMFGDGSSGQPVGLLQWANNWVQSEGGTIGSWSTTGNSTAAVDNASFTGDPRYGHNGGNFITSTEVFTLATAAAEAGGMIQKLDSANLKGRKRVWFMNPRAKNYLFNVQNSLGLYVYREEMVNGTFLSYPFKDTTEIGNNYHDASSSSNDCSFIFLTDMNEVMIFDSMTLELEVSREGTYIDANSNVQSAFQKDLTLIRAVTEHDFQMRHTSGVAVNQFNRWAPAIS